ncbi:uncharacterized protein LOC117526217 isoform X2 [Thalassophryne amazonica]|uniref:uncharacterized protein LOC117526217 isoform X2 n=1 Tax=Thalassophryne amazonica TaxID=390379 RepID=UPI001470FB33|nr:uncharacterized protein LOC117526217 isoform X2 [Thalassophryne amazonica]
MKRVHMLQRTDQVFTGQLLVSLKQEEIRTYNFHTNMFVVSAIALLSLMPVSHSAPQACEDLIRPLDHLDPHHLDGRWAMVAGSLSHAASLDALKLRDSITIYFSGVSNTSTTSSYTQVNRFQDQCQYLYYNISTQGSNFTFNVGGRFNLTGVMLNTVCPDCLVMRWDVASKKRVSLDLYLLSRRQEVEQEEMEAFKAQLTCLHLPPPVVMDPMKELCPEETKNQTPAFQTVEKMQ